MRKAALYAGGIALFTAGLIVGSVMTPVSAQVQPKGMRLNHVGINARDFQQTLDFYTKVMGFKVAFQFPSNNGGPSITFVQIDRDTFLDIDPPRANVTPGLTHIGVWVDDMNDAIAKIRAAGGTVSEPRPIAYSNEKLADVIDPNGLRIELTEQAPNAIMRKAIEAWR